MNKEQADFLLQSTNLCVKCGLCLPQCPTYNLEQNEANSPRGRITLIQGLASKQLSLRDPSTRSYIDNCLKCNNCELTCPAKVPFTQMLLTTKTLLYQQQKPKLSIRAKIVLLYSKNPIINKIITFFIQTMSSIFWSSPRSIQQKITPYINSYFLPKSSNNLNKLLNNKNRQNIGLFLGCTAKLFANETIISTQDLLNKLGFKTFIPKQHHCCGGLHQTIGDTKTAKNLLKKSNLLFATTSIQYIITIAHGCYDFLAMSKDDSNLKRLLLDINILILQQAKTISITFKAYPKTVAVHIPCSLNKYSESKAALLTILNKIPKIKIIFINIQQACCGASGLHMINNKKKSLQYTQPLIEQIKKYQPDLILSNNTGCTLQLRHSLTKNNLQIPIQHPTLLINKLILITPKLNKS